MEHFLIYTKDNCRYCDMSKQYLTDLGETFDTIEVNSKEIMDSMNEKIEKNGGISVKTVPQIFQIDNDKECLYIGGYDQLIDFFEGKYGWEKML